MGGLPNRIVFWLGAGFGMAAGVIIGGLIF